MRIVWAPEALSDFRAAFAYLDERNPRAARRLGQRLLTLVERLGRGDFEGREEVLRSGAIVRSWPVPPFRVYYQRGADRLLVLRVYHQARRPIAR